MMKAQPNRMVTWNKPPTRWIKPNVNGCCRGNPGPCGGGKVLPNDQGTFRVSFSKNFDKGTNNRVQLQALPTRVKLYKQLGFQHVIKETDSELVVGWITKQSCSAWYLLDYWDGLKAKLQRIEFKINPNFREINQIANFLTINGEGDKTYKYLHFDDLPKEVCGMLLLDKLGLSYWQLQIFVIVCCVFFMVWWFVFVVLLLFTR